MRVKILNCFPVDAGMMPPTAIEIALRGQIVEIEYMFGDGLYGFRLNGKDARPPIIVYLYEEEFEVLND